MSGSTNFPGPNPMANPLGTAPNPMAAGLGANPMAANPMGGPMLRPPGVFPGPMGPMGAMPLGGPIGAPLGQPGFAPMMPGMPTNPGLPGVGAMPGLPMPGLAMTGLPPGMAAMPPGMAALSPMILREIFGVRKNAVKEIEFGKGLYVYDFEETMTGEQLFKHFNAIKPVQVIKFPTTKQRYSKKYAFVYFKTAEDAAYVRDVIKRDQEEEARAIQNKASEDELAALKKRHIVLRKPVKITSLGLNDFTKLLLKPRLEKNGGAGELKRVQDAYFNATNLENEIRRIIPPEMRLNKVVVPKSQKDEQASLPYARAYFDLNVRADIDTVKDMLEKDDAFKKYVEVLTFKAQNVASSNMLYVKGLAKPGELVDPALSEELKTTFEGFNPSWKISSVFVKANDRGAWGYVCFETAEMCREAFEYLKPLKHQFRGNTLFANIKNQSDPRTVIIYDLREGVTNEQINAFFRTISENSKREVVPQRRQVVEPQPQQALDTTATSGVDQPAPVPKPPVELKRRFDFYDINILESRVVEKRFAEVEIPRRLVITFVDNIDSNKLQELVSDIRINEQYKDLFRAEKFRAKCLRPFKVAGHIDSDGRYITHKNPQHTDKINKIKRAEPRPQHASHRNPNFNAERQQNAPHPQSQPQTGGQPHHFRKNNRPNMNNPLNNVPNKFGQHRNNNNNNTGGNMANKLKPRDGGLLPRQQGGNYQNNNNNNPMGAPTSNPMINPMGGNPLGAQRPGPKGPGIGMPNPMGAPNPMMAGLKPQGINAPNPMMAGKPNPMGAPNPMMLGKPNPMGAPNPMMGAPNPMMGAPNPMMGAPNPMMAGKPLGPKPGVPVVKPPAAQQPEADKKE